MSDSNRGRLSYNRKLTSAIATGALQTVNMLNESFAGTKQTAQDDTIREDGNENGLIMLDMQGSGGFTAEFGPDWHDDFFEAALRSVYDTPVSISEITLSITAGTPATLDDSGSGLAVLEVGDIVWIAGFTTAANNGACFVSAVAAGSISVIPLDPTQTMVTEAAGDSVTIKTTRMMNANANNFFDFEKLFGDLSNVYHTYLNQQLNTLTVEFGAGAKVAFSVGFIGDKHNTAAATIGSSYVAQATSKALNPENHFLGSLVGNNGAAVAPVGSCVTKIAITITNTARRTKGLSDVCFGKGSFNVQVNLDMMFENNDHYEQFVSHNEVAIATGIADASGNGYGFHFPKLEYADAKVNISGKNADVPQTFQATASWKLVGAETYTMKICKLSQ